MVKTEIVETVDDSLWVLVRLENAIYAFKGVQVESILLLDREIIKLPDSDELRLGTLVFRDGITPVLDLRNIVGMESRETEQNRFEQMLEARKQDHIRWVDTLKASVAAGEPFTLATDPHKCTFGKWYDHYESDNQTVAFHLRKIDEPHKNLHRMAEDMLSCKQEHSTCKRDVCLKDSLRRAVDVYMPQVVLLLEEAKQVFRDSYRKMVVILSNGTSSCGFLVDEVLSAEPLGTLTEVYKSPESGAGALVTHLGKRKGSNESVLVMDLNQLFERFL